MKTNPRKRLLFSGLSFLTLFMIVRVSWGQTITGSWRGRINAEKVELKLVKSGDSVLGTSYYYSSKNHFRRYSVKGYFDSETNDVIWWDDALLEDNGSKNILRSPGEALLSIADFNCPNDTEMRLDGRSNSKDDMNSPRKELHLQKIATPLFSDEWDFVIENYNIGANDPYIIDSIAHLHGTDILFPEEEIVASPPRTTTIPGNTGPSPEVKVVAPPANEKTIPSTAPQTVENKFISRKKVLQTVIPITSNIIELRFYDNAQIDGDSIALFLNNRLIFEHIYLTDKAYVVKLNASELSDDNELVMVAENLGSIPPNTSYMVAIVGDKRYEARLFANENSSALVRFVRNPSSQ